MEKFDVVLTGNVISEDIDEAVRRMAEFGRISEEKARDLIASGRITTIKKAVDENVAARYRDKLTAIGVEVVLRQSLAESAPAAPSPASPSLAKRDTPPVTPLNARPREEQGRQQPDLPSNFVAPPRRRKSRKKDGAEAAANPYQAPQSEIYQESDENIVRTGGWGTEAQKLPASHGWLWIKGAIGLFWEYYWSWMFFTFVWGLILGLISLIPSGNIIPTILMPFFMAGIMLTVDGQLNGEAVKVKGLFSGFKQQNGLWKIGLIYFAGSLILLLPFIAFFGVGILGSIGDEAALQRYFESNFLGLILALLIAALFGIPLVAGYIFAPALVVFAEEGAFASYKAVIKGIIKNWLPFLVNGFILLGIFMIVMIVGGVVVFFFSTQRSGVFAFSLFAVIIMFLCSAFGSIMNIMTYMCCRDMFYEG